MKTACPWTSETAREPQKRCPWTTQKFLWKRSKKCPWKLSKKWGSRALSRFTEKKTLPNCIALCSDIPSLVPTHQVRGCWPAPVFFENPGGNGLRWVWRNSNIDVLSHTSGHPPKKKTHPVIEQIRIALPRFMNEFLPKFCNSLSNQHFVTALR